MRFWQLSTSDWDQFFRTSPSLTSSAKSRWSCQRTPPSKSWSWVPPHNYVIVAIYFSNLWWLRYGPSFRPLLIVFGAVARLFAKTSQVVGPTTKVTGNRCSSAEESSSHYLKGIGRCSSPRGRWSLSSPTARIDTGAWLFFNRRVVGLTVRCLVRVLQIWTFQASLHQMAKSLPHQLPRWLACRQVILVFYLANFDETPSTLVSSLLFFLLLFEMGIKQKKCNKRHPLSKVGPFQFLPLKV